MRSERLLSIMLLLQTHGQLSAGTLAERLEVSTRTIMRDVEALSASGVPVYSLRGPHGGIALLPGYRTDVTGLTADESRALFVLLSGEVHSDLGLGEAITSALRKVMAALPSVHRPDADLVSRRILVDPSRWRGAGAQPAVELETLQQAVFADKRLWLRYRHGGDHVEGSYTVDPHGLVSKAGTWYLVAEHRSQARLFRADRVREARVLDQDVRRADGRLLPQIWDGLRREIDDAPAPVRVEVRVKRAVLPLFLRLHETDRAPDTELEEDGAEHVRATLALRGLHAGNMLLAFGPDVEVLSPPELRELLGRRAQETSRQYLN
ncbi:helix-turn-helix transcriptional regulator [Kineosporia babensis]|uniref:YafY family transcriptional regulator n=1 Tax=Kineosporia babensis TaxID=499548 RepID=A0A9X1NI56_9ACTN|nr:YafY family protein [Kineosporia babensis]MCD5314279.1 YafY family transcriptional regulator [Kineosporia babensis]